MSEKDENPIANLIVRGAGLVVIIGVIWGWDSFDKVLDLFGLDATEKRQTELLGTLTATQNYQNPMQIGDVKSFKEKLTSFTEIQEENYEAEMENTVWEVSGEVYDVEKNDVYAGFENYEIDLIIRMDDSFISPRVYADCFARNQNEKNMIESLSAKTLITLRGSFKSVASQMGGYLYLDNCVITDFAK